MKIKLCQISFKFFTIFFTSLLLVASAIWAETDEYQDPSDGCTIGVASGRATSDGRPLLWKTRDATALENEVYFNTAFPIKFVCVISAGATSSSWMGVNESGFAIINSASGDLPAGTTGMGNGTIMAYALGTCGSVTEFQHLLDSTNVTGRLTQANFGVIDSCGAAAIFETGDSMYWKFDANDTIQSPEGYVLRTNFAINGGGSAGIERYRRTCQLIADYHAGDTLNYRSILRHQMRDFSDYDSNPFPIPYPYQIGVPIPFGYIYTDVSICRNTTVSAAVIHGVLPGEDVRLSTLWAILGQAATGLAVPYWPVGPTPAAANGPTTAPLCDVANRIRGLLFDWPVNTVFINTYRLLDGQGDGLWTYTYPAEDSIITATGSILQNWRHTPPSVSDMLTYEGQCADYALNKLQESFDLLMPIVSRNSDVLPENMVLYQNYPNPFNPTTVITWQQAVGGPVKLTVYNLIGQWVATLVDGSYPAGNHSMVFDGAMLASGIYYYKLQAGDLVRVRKMILLE